MQFHQGPNQPMEIGPLPLAYETSGQKNCESTIKITELVECIPIYASVKLNGNLQILNIPFEVLEDCDDTQQLSSSVILLCKSV